MLWIIATVIILIGCLVLASSIRTESISRREKWEAHRKRYPNSADDDDEAPEVAGFWLNFAVPFVMLMVVNTIAFSVTWTATCDRKVLSFLRVPVEGYIANGLQWTAPWYDTEAYDVCRQIHEFTDNETFTGMAKGGVTLTKMDAAVPVRLLPDNLWRVRQFIGGQDKLNELFRNTARSAARETQANYEWREITYDKRTEVEEFFSQELSKRLVADLKGAGLTDQEAAAVFIIPETRIRAVMPSTAVQEEQSNLEKVKVQYDAAVIRAKQAQQEAAATKARLNDLGFTITSADQAARILHALADYARADALNRIAADENRNIPVMILGGDSNVTTPLPTQGVAVPAPATAQK